MKRYLVKADHPVLARQDKIVSELELGSFKMELELAGYENIKVEEFPNKKT